jgi:hypothetical protein
MIVHDSAIGTVEFRGIKNMIITKRTNFLVFKIKKMYNSNLFPENLSKFYSDVHKFYQHLYTEKIQFVQIYDLTQAEVSSVWNDIIFVKEYAEFLKSNIEKIIATCCAGTSLIVNSEILKSIVNGLLCFYYNIKPTEVHNSYADSYTWLWTLIKND